MLMCYLNKLPGKVLLCGCTRSITSKTKKDPEVICIVLCSRKDIIEAFKLSSDDITEMAVAQGSTAEFVRQTPGPSINIYDALKEDPHPDIKAMVEKEIAKKFPKAKPECTCDSSLLRLQSLVCLAVCVSRRPQ
jgi:hypothetical protein